jgi:hypothetical protein
VIFAIVPHRDTLRLTLYSAFANVAFMVNNANKTYNDSEVLMALRKATKGLSVRKAGATLGVSGAYIHDILHNRRGISEVIANRLGFMLIPPPKPIARRWTRKGA